MTRAACLAAGLLGVGLALVPRPAPAPTTTGTLAVSAVVQTSCSLTGGTMSFGTYTSGQTANLDTDGQIGFANCPVGNLVFELDGGGSGSTTARRMKSGSNELNYQLYRNSTRTAVFGTSTNAYTEIRLVAGGGTIPVYGRIPGNQTVPAGNYADTVNVTLTFP
jgi:spore coat protein U-like protein